MRTVDAPIDVRGKTLNLRRRQQFLRALAGGAASVAYTGLVANRTRINSTLNGTNKQAMSYSPHKTRDAVTSLKLVFAHWILGGTGGSFEVGHGTDAWLTASIEYDGTITQVTFPAEYQATGPTVALMPIVSTTAAVSGGGNVFSDDIPVSIPADTWFHVRYWYDSTRGGAQTGGGIFYNSGIRDGAHGDQFRVGVSGITDQTMSGTVTGNFGATNGSCPLAILGTTTKGSTIIVGDSIAYGQNGLTKDPLNSRTGLFATAFPTDHPFLNLASPALKATNCLTASPNRQELYAYCSNMVNNLGINDTSGATAADIAAANTAIAAAFPARVKKYVSTLTPRAISSTDGYTTNAGQTVHGSTATLYQPYNTLVRAGISGYDDFIELTWGVAEALPNNSGKWALAPVARILTDAVTTAGSLTITSATGAFSASDVGVGISIAGAHTAGAVYNTQIATAPTSTSITGGFTTAIAVNPATLKIGALVNDGLHPLPYTFDLLAPSIPSAVWADPT